jgi:hypothetical protein
MQKPRKDVFFKTAMSVQRSYRLSALVLILLAATSHRLASAEAVTGIHSVAQINRILQELCERLSMQQSIQVSITAHNEHLVSIERVVVPRETFTLSFDEQFLKTLTDDELTAAIAHELGHVWIYTHHPYLQTEELANEIAMRLVSRESLMKTYAKVWERVGTGGDVAGVLGPGK